MKKPMSLEEFYNQTANGVPSNLRAGIGHFNVFRLDQFAGPKPKPMPYNRRDYFKITLVKGESRVHYADKVVKVDKQAIVFSNPQIPYNWESIEKQLTGYFCVFTESFFHQFGGLDYPVFQAGKNHVYILSDDERLKFENIFEKMFEEINSDYSFKYDVLRNMVLDIIHSVMKLQPANLASSNLSNANERIYQIFSELLERQFPIENINQKIALRKASDYAEKLNIHVNHLNRAIKEIQLKTTTEVITERIIQEAKILLRHSNWNISEISSCLAFEEAAHFTNFFKKHTNSSPIAFRNEAIV